MSKIEWTDMTLNTSTGCEKISAGCQNCYAEKMHSRLRSMGNWKYSFDFNTIRMWRSVLETKLPKKPKRIFVNSMADLFHDRIDFLFMLEVLEMAADNPKHTFQILTKRPERALKFSNWMTAGKPWPSNVWLGVTVENKKEMHRIDTLKKIPAALRFISFEPLLSYVPVSTEMLNGIGWVIVGAETGPGARKMEISWVYNLATQAIISWVPFFFKKASKGDVCPDELMVREFPENK